MRRSTDKAKKLTVLIPCFNESKGIGSVIDKVPLEKLHNNNITTQIIVIDNNSTDDTAKVARKHGATVITEEKKGKGNAIRTGFASVSEDTDFVIMLDGDDTYDASEIPRMIEPIDNKYCNVVIGSRLGGKMAKGSMTNLNRGGNWFFTHIVRLYFSVNVTDVLTGYFAWEKSKLDELFPHLISQGFAIEMEMIAKMAKLGHDIYSVPITYTPRSGETNLRPFYDGRRILKMYFSTLRWQPKKQAIPSKADQ